MFFESGERIIFAGDTVTWCNRSIYGGEGLFDGVGKGYVRMIENILHVVYPENLYWITNAAVQDITSSDMAQNTKKYVPYDSKPAWISIMIGIKDICRRFENPCDEHITAEQYRANLRKILDESLPNVKGGILISPYFLDTNREDPMRRAVDEYIDVCREIAREYNLIYVEPQKAFDEFLQYRHASYISSDRITPGYYGNAIIAREFLKAVGADRPFV